MFISYFLSLLLLPVYTFDVDHDDCIFVYIQIVKGGLLFLAWSGKHCLSCSYVFRFFLLLLLFYIHLQNAPDFLICSFHLLCIDAEFYEILGINLIFFVNFLINQFENILVWTLTSKFKYVVQIFPAYYCSVFDSRTMLLKVWHINWCHFYGGRFELFIIG